MMRTACVGALVLALVGGSANAGVVIFDLALEYSGGTPPVGSPPWVRVSLDDGGSAGSVDLTFADMNLTGDEFMRSCYLNLDPNLDPNSLIFAKTGSTGALDDPSISTAVDSFQADGDGRFDILFEFTHSDGASKKFTAGDSITYSVTGIPTLTAASFDFDSAPFGGHGPFPVASHVQGISPGAEDSGWVTVPEPATLALLALGGVGVGLVRRRK